MNIFYQRSYLSICLGVWTDSCCFLSKVWTRFFYSSLLFCLSLTGLPFLSESFSHSPSVHDSHLSLVRREYFILWLFCLYLFHCANSFFCVCLGVCVCVFVGLCLRVCGGASLWLNRIRSGWQSITWPLCCLIDSIFQVNSVIFLLCPLFSVLFCALDTVFLLYLNHTITMIVSAFTVDLTARKTQYAVKKQVWVQSWMLAARGRGWKTILLNLWRLCVFL